MPEPRGPVTIAVLAACLGRILEQKSLWANDPHITGLRTARCHADLCGTFMLKADVVLSTSNETLREGCKQLAKYQQAPVSGFFAQQCIELHAYASLAYILQGISLTIWTRRINLHPRPSHTPLAMRKNHTHTPREESELPSLPPCNNPRPCVYSASPLIAFKSPEFHDTCCKGRYAVDQLISVYNIGA